MHILIILLFILTSCDDAQEVISPPPIAPLGQQEQVEPKFTLSKAHFSDLPDWQNENFNKLEIAFGRSCGRILKADPKAAFGVLEQAGTYQDWQIICKKIAGIDVSNPEDMREFFEENFTPYSVSSGDNPIGLFTGYYEASLNGSHIKKSPYIYPLHKRPDDLVMLQLGDFREDLKGVRIAGRVVGSNLKPYEKRSEIVSGNWEHKADDNVLLWVDSAIDAFFVQIQGSGLVQMADGSTKRIGYAGQNGHPYYAIGRELVKNGALTKENVSMQSIRTWLEEHPDQADKIMNTNKSYVFFRDINGDGPLGAEGVALTAGRSLAVDRTLISYGAPIWVDIEPVKDANNIRRLMIAQDTGGAITGAVRADVFWGYGAQAEEMAGHMKSKGRYWILLPDTLLPDTL